MARKAGRGRAPRAEPLYAERWRRPRELPGLERCARGGGGAGCPRVRGAMAAVPGIQGIAGLQGIQTCLRVAGAAAARPECFLRYRGAAGGGIGSLEKHLEDTTQV